MIHVHTSQTPAHIFYCTDKGALYAVIFWKASDSFRKEIMVYGPLIFWIIDKEMRRKRTLCCWLDSTPRLA